MKVECAMRIEQIDDLVINHSLTPLPERKQMRILDAEEMESLTHSRLLEGLKCESK
jgi:hypothetical protein